jgi:GNAT superfamily N-acetyltransferase
MTCADQTIRVRPWRTGDAELVRRAATGLSTSSLRLRFGSGTPSVPRAYLRMLEHQPACSRGTGDESLVVALDGDRLIGWAETRPAGPGEAELAVVVLDDWQGRGVGTLLVKALLAEAATSGRTLHAYVLPENSPAHRLVRAAMPDGYERVYHEGYVHYTLAA